MAWRTQAVGAVCTPTEQRDPREDPAGEFRYVDIAGIDRVHKRIAETQALLGAEAPSRARKVIRKDDVLVSTVRPNLNAVAMVPKELDGEIASTGFCVLRANLALVEPRYLFYRAISSDFVGALTAKVRGANYPAVSDSDVKDIEIPLPLLSEQRRIVEILDQADHLRRLRTEADTKADRILMALFLKMFKRGASVGREERLDELVDIGSALVDPNQGGYLDLAHVGGEQIEKDTGRILELRSVRDSHLRSGKFLFTDRHVLYSKIRPYLNKVAYPRFAGLCSADIYPLLPKDRRVGPWFLTSLLRSEEFLAFARRQSNRLRMPKLNREQLGGYLVRLPDPGGLEAFESRAEQLAGLGESRLQARARIDSLFQIALSHGFRGDLTAAWREAHMKDLLQEMEQQAKALGEA